jgi:hypothetical protein
VVAERLGFARQEARSLGRSVAGLNAYSMGRSLGTFPAYAQDSRGGAEDKPAEDALGCLGCGAPAARGVSDPDQTGSASPRQGQSGRSGGCRAQAAIEIRRCTRVCRTPDACPRKIPPARAARGRGVRPLRVVPAGDPCGYGRVWRSRSARTQEAARTSAPSAPRVGDCDRESSSGRNEEAAPRDGACTNPQALAAGALSQRESQREGLEGHRGFRTPKRPRDAGLRHLAGEGFQLAHVFLRPRTRCRGAATGTRRGTALLGNSGHVLILSDVLEGRIL